MKNKPERYSLTKKHDFDCYDAVPDKDGQWIFDPSHAITFDDDIDLKSVSKSIDLTDTFLALAKLKRWGDIERLVDIGLRHRGDSEAYDYLLQFLKVTRCFAYATRDGSWGELEKHLAIIITRMLRAEERLRRIDEAIASCEDEY